MLITILASALIGLADAPAAENRTLHDKFFTLDTHVDVLRIEEAENKNYLQLPDVQVDIARDRKSVV